MRDGVFYFRTPKTGPDVVPIDDDHFVADARSVLELTEGEIDRISSGIDEYSGFLGHDALRELVGTIVPNEERATHVAHFIGIFDGFFRQSKSDLDAFYELFALRLKKDGSKTFSEQDIVSLIGRARKLVRDQLPLLLQWKASDLASATGRALERLRVICDLRPVFDNNRAKIEGMLPFTTLQVVSTDYNGMPLCLEVFVGEDQLKRAIEELQRAQRKIQNLRELLAEKGVRTPAIEVPGDEAADSVDK